MINRLYIFVIILPILVIGWISFAHWSLCWKFVDQFYATKAIRANDLLILTNGEKGVPIFFVRALFNKVSFLPWEVLQSLLQFWDIRFLQRFVGVVGGIGAYMGLWYFFTRGRKNFLLWIVFLLGIIIPIGIMLFSPHVSFGYQVLFLYVLFELLAVYGWWQFLEPKPKIWKVLFVLFLTFLSIVYLIYYPTAYQLYCLHI